MSQRRKIGLDAFNYYCALGVNRSYALVASHYNCSKRAVTRIAAMEGWAKKLQEMEETVAEKSTRIAVESGIRRRFSSKRSVAEIALAFSVVEEIRKIVRDEVAEYLSHVGGA